MPGMLQESMTPKIIAILGSPIPDGNTARLLNRAVQGAEDAGCVVERVDVSSLRFRPCMEIFQCLHIDECAIEDDVTPYYRKFREMDGLIVAAPVMTMGIPGALKSFMDRFQVFFNAKYMRRRPLVSSEHKKRRRTLFISIGGMDIENDFDCSVTSMKAFCDIIDCPYWGDVLQNNMDAIKDIATRPDVMQAAYEKARTMCTLIRNDMPGAPRGPPAGGRSER